MKLLRFAAFLVAFTALLVVGKTTSHLSPGPHVTDVNILLPPKMTRPVEYRLQGSDGCFKWSWDHHDILSVIPEYNASNSQCSTSARLRSIAPFTGRKETAIYAADVHTGIVIRCKVFIDNISRIQIFHNSIKLDLDGLATLRARAFDSEDNVFSSLAGLQFMWQLMPETDGLPHHLVHVPLRDSPLSDCGGLCGDLNIQIELEDSGVFSDLYVVKGVEIGHENVAVHFLEPQFKHLADKIVLTVAEAMSLEPPSPVLVLIGAAFRYTLKVIRGNILQVVALPSPHHRWSVLNSSVAEVDHMSGFAQALSLGVTSVIVEDTRVAGHMQVSSLNVVLPDTLCLYIMPLSNSGDPIDGLKATPSLARWFVVSGRQYLIQMKVFLGGPDAQEIYITESDDLKLHHEQSKYWTIFMLSEDIVVKHGWRNSRILRANSLGLGKVSASLTYFSRQQERKKVLNVEQEIMVCDQVKFSLDGASGTHQTILLPWTPTIYQEVELKAIGGCAKTSSDYKWFSSDTTTVSISPFGVLQAKKPGKATIRVVSVFDSSNHDEVVIEVSVPSSMIMLQNFPVETVVGSYLPAAITMKASDGSESFVIVNATEGALIAEKLGSFHLYESVYGPPCSWTYIYASGPGQTTLQATLLKEYHLDNSFHGSIILKASSRIAAYPPLTVHQVVDGSQFGGYWLDLGRAESSNHLELLESLYLVPGTSLDIMLLGGPAPWDKDFDYLETVEISGDKHASSKDGIHVHKISGSYQIMYRVSCQLVGIFDLVFKRGNLVGDGHPLPVIADVALSVTCNFPSSIALIVDEPVNRHDSIRLASLADHSTGQIRTTPVTVANGQTIRVAAVGIGVSGEAFANSSSLSLKWELSSCEGLAYWADAYELQKSKSSWERFLVLENESGQCIVRATVIGLDDAVDSHYLAQLRSLENVLTDAVKLQLVSSLRVNPEFNLLYFNPDAKANLSIAGGSCLWEAVVNDSQVVEVAQPPPGLQCVQLRLLPKMLGIALVSISDIGLIPHTSTSAVVQVADVDWIKIVSGEQISLMEGQSQPIHLMAGIKDGNAFDSHQYACMKIQVHIEDPIVELVDKNGMPSDAGGYINAPNFTISAKDLGFTTLYVSVRQQSGHEILSQSIKIEVYAPLRIHPDDIFLLAMKGGPTIGVYFQYASMDDGIATVDKSSGRLCAISPGNATILSTVFGNGRVVVCQAHGRINVGVPSLSMLNAQSNKLDVGREMPIYPSFPEGDLFSFYELCRSYKWTIEDEKVLSFNMAERLNVEKHWFPLDDEQELDFIKVLHGRSAGKANITVTFSCDFISASYSQSRLYDATLSLLVVPPLPLDLGGPMTWLLPPHYSTSSLLPSSLESHGQQDGQGRRGTIIYSLLRSCEKNEVWKKDAISIDGDRIKTTESNNLACIQAKDRTTGRTEIASCVRVAEVAQIRIMNRDPPFHVIYLAVGANLDLPISYFDASGNPFYEAHDVISYHAETNYHEIVSIVQTRNGNGTIHLKAMQTGRALVRVSMNSNPQKFDYILVSVGAHLHPQNPVLQHGSSLNFSVIGIDDQVSCCWHSANERVISVDMRSGKAEACGIGSTHVFFESPSMKLQTAITVLSGNIVSINAPKEILTNIPYPAKGYSFPLSLSDTYNKLETLGNGKGVSYDCKVDPPFVGYAKPWVDLESGNSYCLFFPYSPEHLVHSVPRLKDMRPYVSISINVSLREASHVSGSASAIFVGGFSILEMDKSSMQLNLTPDSNKTIITVLGNTDVEIHWLDRDSMKITLINKEDFGIGGRAQYEVEILRAKRLKDRIIITLPANGQRIEILVTYEPDAETGAKTSFTTVIGLLIAGCVVLCVIYLGCSLLISEISNIYARSTTPATPPSTAPETPVRSSPVLIEQSPRTPQPFVDYMKLPSTSEKLGGVMDPHHNEPIHDGEPNDVKSTHIPEDDKPQPLSGDGASPGKIFIGGLARETTTAQFIKHFGKYGEITDSVIMKDRKTGQPRGFGFVTYADPSVVDQVIQDTHIINGKQVEIKRTIPKGAVGSKDFRTRKIFVGGIPAAVTEDEFKEFFTQFGEVTEHQIMRDHSTNRSRGFGFITFDTEQAVDDLLARGNKLELAGTQVEIKKAEPKKANPPPPPSKRYNDSRPAFRGGYDDTYGGFGGSGFGGIGGYRSGGAYGSRAGAYSGYGGGEFGGYGGYGVGGISAYRGEPSLGYTGRYGGMYSRGRAFVFFHQMFDSSIFRCFFICTRNLRDYILFIYVTMNCEEACTLSLIVKLERTPKPKDVAIFHSYPYMFSYQLCPFSSSQEGFIFPYFCFSKSCPNGSLNTMAWLVSNVELLWFCMNKGKCPSVLIGINFGTNKGQRFSEMKI
ncbi:hypothetical protein SADUNF_Sadunf16G0221300 [Salix dunnii]|uniref:RRM domain-containing protein n=1 Tax=Salix dunnii TaxID=1413687 RepID=A0A835JDG6_9ROSI|nr:hypothetical protein SADUNF_Sadunf16G0221300 [Salix dunnii]